MTTENEQRFVAEEDAAKILGLKVATLRDWRFRNVGPSFHRFGRAVRYRVRALEEFARRSEVATGQSR